MASHPPWPSCVGEKPRRPRGVLSSSKDVGGAICPDVSAGRALPLKQVPAVGPICPACTVPPAPVVPTPAPSLDEKSPPAGTGGPCDTIDIYCRGLAGRMSRTLYAGLTSRDSLFTTAPSMRTYCPVL